MKLLLLLLLSILPVNAAYSFYRIHTIDHTQVPNTDSANFPVLVQGTYSYLATVANGGKAQNGNDIGFFTSTACTTKLDWEIELYTATTGKVVYWIRLSNVSHTVDTLYYECYGDASVTTDQSNKNGVWDSSYKGVYHLREASGPYKDSTSNANDSTGGTAPTQATAQIGFGQTFTAASSQDIVLTNNFTTYTAGLTISGWCKAVASQYCFIWDTRGNVPLAGFSIYVDGPSGKGSFYINAPGFVTIASSANLVDSSFHYLVATYNGTSKVGTFYVDGVSQGTSTATADPIFTAGNSEIQAITQVSLFGSGTVDEIRVTSSLTRTSDWQATEYANQKTSSTFITIGSEQTTGGGGTPTVIIPGIL